MLGEMPLGQPLHRGSVGGAAEKSLVPGECRDGIVDSDSIPARTLSVATFDPTSSYCAALIFQFILRRVRGAGFREGLLSAADAPGGMAAVCQQ